MGGVRGISKGGREGETTEMGRTQEGTVWKIRKQGLGSVRETGHSKMEVVGHCDTSVEGRITT